MTQPTKLAELIERETKTFHNKLKTYDKDGGFIVFVEDESNRDFDVELIEEFHAQSLHRVSSAMMKEMLADVVGEDEHHHYLCNFERSSCDCGAKGRNNARQEILSRASKNWNITIGEGDNK